MATSTALGKGSDRDPKTCTKCGVEQPLTAFYQQRSEHRDGEQSPKKIYYAHCRTCAVAKVKAYTARHREKVLKYKREHYQKIKATDFSWRNRSYQREYHSSQAVYDLQFSQQHGRCAICLREPAAGERRFAFDHDHDTGLTRGVLCSACNGGLGCFRDRPDLLRAAVVYLAQWAELHAPPEAVNGI